MHLLLQLLLQLMSNAHNKPEILLWERKHVKVGNKAVSKPCGAIFLFTISWFVMNMFAFPLQDSPQQHNGDDCGVFVLVSGERLAAGAKGLFFCQEDITALRKKILHEVLKGELLPWPAN